MSILNRFTGGKYKSTQASSFWLEKDFDVQFKVGTRVDYTKLAAAQRAIGNFVNIVTGKQIPVVFQSNDSSYTDGESVVIGTKLEDKNFDPAVGLALHEGSHIAYTDFELFKGATSLRGSNFATYVRMRGVDPEFTMTEQEFKLIKDLLNWIEDRRIDYKVYTQAPGYRMYYEAMYNKYFNDKIIDKALASGEKVKEDWDCYMFHIINLTNPNRKLDALVKLREIWKLIDLQNIHRLTNTTQALDIAIDIYKIINAIVKEQDLEDIEDMFAKNGMANGQGSSNGEASLDDVDEQGEESDDDSDDEEEEDDSGSESDPGNKQGLSAADLQKLEKAIRAQRDFLNGKQQKKGRLNKTQSRLVNAMRESGTETREVYTGPAGTTDPITTVVIKKLTPGLICAMPSLFKSGAEDVINGKKILNPASSWGKSMIEMDAAVHRGIILGKQLGNKLQLRNADRTLKSTRLQSGKIDRRLVAQLGFDNANVFHRIVTDRYKNYFIHISVDASGSMGGNKIRQAITSTVAIAQAASMTTGIRVQISLRGTDTNTGGIERCVTLYAYDSAHDKMSKIRSMFKYLDVFGCTPEGLSFKSIEKDIKADAKGDELIFINYSDGAPTSVAGCYNYYDGRQFTKHVVTNMRELGFNIISYFIADEGGSSWAGAIESFKSMYGPDSKFIRPCNVVDVAKTINAKFLEIAN
jgi:ribosomal protein L12E/L44/L45/RPP1/RPP2